MPSALRAVGVTRIDCYAAVKITSKNGAAETAERATHEVKEKWQN